MRVAVAAAAVCFCVMGLVKADNSEAVARQSNIPAQVLGSALQLFASTYHLQVLYKTEVVAGKSSAGAIGAMAAPQALGDVLKGTGLTYQFLDERTVMILPDNALLESAAPQSAAEKPATPSSASVQDESRLDEIIVTAQKRSERPQDVPVPLSVVSATDLSQDNRSRLQDYFATVPGLSFTSAGTGGTALLSIRGLTTGYVTGPTVALTIDDVPFGSSTGVGLGFLQIPDIDPADLSHVEVLRGPQGTLYGASSLGGLIKYVTVEPSAAVSGHVQVLAENIDSGGLGYAFRAAVNIPVSDNLAIRASGFVRRDPGYIDNVETGQRDTGQVDVGGGHVAALWSISDNTSLKLSALLQHTSGQGDGLVDVNTSVQPLYGDLTESRLRNTGTYHSELFFSSSVFKARLGSLDLTSITGFTRNTYSTLQDAPSFAEFSGLFYNVGGAGLSTSFNTRKFSQELRLSSPDGQRLEWMVGGFYTHEDNPVAQRVSAIDPSSGATVGPVADFEFPSTLSELAAFADATLHITDQLSVQLGGRGSQNRQIYNETDSGLFVPVAEGFPSPLVFASEHTKDHAVTYLFTPEYRFSPDLMTYLRFASGYRPGGPNFTAILFNAPLQYQPDKTYNYEVGVKGVLFNPALTFDASAYYIDWRNIQLTLTDPTTQLNYFGNAASARSEGVELSVQAHPMRGLTLGSSLSLGNAQLTANLPPTSSGAFARSGDRLPFSAQLSGSVSADQDIPLTAATTGFAGALLSYVGNREGTFAETAASPRLDLPAYLQLNLHTGVRYQSWNMSLFGNNITNRRGVLMLLPHTSDVYSAYYIQPLIVGLSIAKDF